MIIRMDGDALRMEPTTDKERYTLLALCAQWQTCPPATRHLYPEMLAHIAEKPGTRADLLAEMFDVSASQANNCLMDMVKLGIIERHTEVVKEGGRRYVYSLVNP